MGFFATMTDGRALLRHELTWIRQTPEEAALDVRAHLEQWKIPALSYTVANPELFPSPGDSGPTDAETFRRAGLVLRRGSSDRLNGWSRLRSWLQPYQGIPNLRIHASCTYFLNTFPTLTSDPQQPDDLLAVPGDDYPANGARYYVMSRPVLPKAYTPPLPDDAVGHWVQEVRQLAVESSPYG